MSAPTRGAQNLIEGYARTVARGGAGPTMRDNIAAMDVLISAGLVGDGNSVDGKTRSGEQAFDVVIAQFPREPLAHWEVPAPRLQVIINFFGMPLANPDGSAPAVCAPGDLYDNGGFVCIAH